MSLNNLHADLCPFGYELREGDIDGWGALNPGGGAPPALTREECAAECSQQATCLSFEHSYTEGLCNLNTLAEPDSGQYEDWAFCTKEGKIFVLLL